MLKKCIFLTFFVVFLLLGCGKVTNSVIDNTSDDNNPSLNNPPEEYATYQPSAIANFTKAICSSLEVTGPQFSATETLVTTAAFAMERGGSNSNDGFSAMWISDGYQYWHYETVTRVVNGVAETVYRQWRYYDLSGVPFTYFYTPGAGQPAFSYIERYVDIVASTYDHHFHEKITYSGSTATIINFPGSTFSSRIVFNGMTLTVTNRNILYNMSTHNGSGTTAVTYGSSMSGSLSMDISSDLVSANGILNVSGKKAIRLVQAYNGSQKTTFMINKSDATNYYYTDIGNLMNDLIDNSYIEFRDSSTYTGQLQISSLSYVTLNVLAGQTPLLQASASYILRINNCDHININGLRFSNTRNNSNYLDLYQASYLTAENCTFSKTGTNKSNYLNIDTCNHITIKNNTFSGNSRRSYGINIYTASIDQNILFNSNTFNYFARAIMINVGSVSNYPITVSNCTITNNDYGIYRSNTSYTFTNTGNTFSGNTVNIR